MSGFRGGFTRGFQSLERQERQEKPMAYSTWRNEAEYHRERLEREAWRQAEIDADIRRYEEQSATSAQRAARIWRQPAQEQKREGWKKGVRAAARAEARRKAVLRLCGPLLAQGEATCEEDYEFGWLE